ncbi:carboxypeptidase regulatory-like domain-containing protein [Bdellovibrionota bacterium FG-2]
MGRTLWILLYLFSGLFWAETAMAYTPTLTGAGVPVKWKSGPVLKLVGNPKNTSGLSDAEVSQAVTRSLQRWKAASDSRVSFDYWQGTDPKTYLSNNTYNGTSSLFFASSAGGANTGLSPSVLGLTQVWYNTETGEILETDVVLNDKDFRFTTDAKATLGYGTIGNERATYRDRVYIENVITHELGHAMGLSHSGGLQSTMLFMEAPEQSHLGCDDQIGIRALYPARDSAQRGAIEGTARDENGAVVFGAHVVAISRRRGVVLASAMSDKSGRYRIEALEPGDYVLMVEPFFAGASALSAYYSSMTSRSCKGGGQLSRTFLVDSVSNLPQRVVVAEGASVAAPDLEFKCTKDGGAAVSEISSARTASTAPEVFDATSRSHGFAVADSLDYGGSVAQYRLKALSGTVEIRALSYSLYSPVQPVLALVDAQGAEVKTTKKSPIYEGDSGYMNLDVSLTVEHLPLGDYTLKVMTNSVSIDAYPAGPYQIDSTPFVLIVGSVNEAAPTMEAAIPFNARCRQDETFAAYVATSGAPATEDSSSDTKGTGTCASVAIASSGGSSGGGASGAAIASWFAPWVLMALIPLIQSCLLARRRLKWVVCQPLI